MFSFPLQVGAARLGSLDLHRDTAGALSRDQLADALMLAGLATEIVLDLTREGLGVDDGAGAGADTPGWLPGVHAGVHEASGMVSEREGIGAAAALLRIRGHAFAHGEPIKQVAARILDRTLTLDDRSADEADEVPDDHPHDHLDHHPDNDRDDHLGPAEHRDENPDDGPARSAGPDVETDR